MKTWGWVLMFVVVGSSCALIWGISENSDMLMDQRDSALKQRNAAIAERDSLRSAASMQRWSSDHIARGDTVWVDSGGGMSIASHRASTSTSQDTTGSAAARELFAKFSKLERRVRRLESSR